MINFHASKLGLNTISPELNLIAKEQGLILNRLSNLKTCYSIFKKTVLRNLIDIAYSRGFDLHTKDGYNKAITVLKDHQSKKLIPGYYSLKDI